MSELEGGKVLDELDRRPWCPGALDPTHAVVGHADYTLAALADPRDVHFAELRGGDRHARPQVLVLEPGVHAEVGFYPEGLEIVGEVSGKEVEVPNGVAGGIQNGNSVLHHDGHMLPFEGVVCRQGLKLADYGWEICPRPISFGRDGVGEVLGVVDVCDHDVEGWSGRHREKMGWVTEAVKIEVDYYRLLVIV